jgi:ABC-type phosphate transport system auxiliary subunit
MNWKFWEKKILSDELGDVQLKVLSRFLLNQQDIINNLSSENQKLIAEVQILRDVVDELSNINNININKALKLEKVRRKTSPFRDKR